MHLLLGFVLLCLAGFALQVFDRGLRFTLGVRELPETGKMARSSAANWVTVITLTIAVRTLCRSYALRAVVTILMVILIAALAIRYAANVHGLGLVRSAAYAGAMGMVAYGLVRSAIALGYGK